MGATLVQVQPGHSLRLRWGAMAGAEPAAVCSAQKAFLSRRMGIRYSFTTKFGLGKQKEEEEEEEEKKESGNQN